MPRVPGATLSGSSHCWPCSQPGQSRPRPRPRPASPKQPQAATPGSPGARRGPGRGAAAPAPRSTYPISCCRRARVSWRSRCAGLMAALPSRGRSPPLLAAGAVPLLLPTQGGPSQEEPGPSRSPCGLRSQQCCARVPGGSGSSLPRPALPEHGGVGGSRNRACLEGTQPLASCPLPNPSPSVPLASCFHEG